MQHPTCSTCGTHRGLIYYVGNVLRCSVCHFRVRFGMALPAWKGDR